MSDVLTRERTETNKRVATLKKETKLEQLHKEELDLEHACYEHTSIVEWIKKLFKKGGESNGQEGT